MFTADRAARGAVAHAGAAGSLHQPDQPAGGQPPPIRLELLPDAARDVLFLRLRRDEAARACCVCAAWRHAFSSAAAAHLWAEITFDAAHFGTLDITPAVVRGAAAKAGAALRTLSELPPLCLPTLPALAAAHPDLRCVRVAPDLLLTDVRGGAVLAAAAAVPELHLGLEVQDRDLCKVAVLRELLLHPSVRLHRLTFGSEDEGPPWPPNARLLLRALAATLRAHASTLRELHAYYYGVAAQPGAEVSEFAEALGRCASLETLRLDGLLGAAAFGTVAPAVARGCCALRELHLGGEDVARYAAGVAEHLLPSLPSLEISHARNDDATTEGLRVLARALHGNATLQRVRVYGLLDQDMKGIPPFAAALASATAVQQLTLDFVGDAHLALFAAAGLPPALERLDARSQNNAPLLGAASRAPLLASFSFDVPGTDVAHTAALCALLAAAPRLRELHMRYDRALERHILWPREEQVAAHTVTVATALRACAPLRTLQLSGGIAAADALLSLAAMALRDNCSLRELRIELGEQRGYNGTLGNRAAAAPAALEHVAAALRTTAAALRVLRICLRPIPSFSLAPVEMQTLAEQARAALAGVPRAASGALLIEVELVQIRPRALRL
jgi:hypothetical protein